MNFQEKIFQFTIVVLEFSFKDVFSLFLQNYSIFTDNKYGDYDSFSKCPLLADYSKERCQFVDDSLDKIYYQVRVQTGNSLSSGLPTPSPPHAENFTFNHKLRQTGFDENGSTTHSLNNDTLLQDANLVYQRLLGDLQKQLQAFPDRVNSNEHNLDNERGFCATLPTCFRLTPTDGQNQMFIPELNSRLNLSMLSLPEDKQMELLHFNEAITRLQQKLSANSESIGQQNSVPTKPVIKSRCSQSLNDSWHSKRADTLPHKTACTEQSTTKQNRVKFADQIDHQLGSSADLKLLKNDQPQHVSSFIQGTKHCFSSSSSGISNDLSFPAVQEDNISIYDNVVDSLGPHVKLINWVYILFFFNGLINNNY